MTEAIRFDGVGLSFPGQRGRPALDVLGGVSFSVARGEFMAMIGPSGCGKSTLLTMLAGYLRPSLGTISVDGEGVTRPGRDRVMVFQQPSLFPWLTARDNVAFGLKLRANRQAGRDVAEAVRDALKLVQLEGFETHYPAELSGGMRQRLEIARALAVDPAVMLMDEPLGALDALTRRTMQREVLRIWEQTRKTILFVTHDIDEALLMADRVLVMSPRPSSIREAITVDLARPRRRDDPRFAALAAHLAELLE